MTTQTHLTSLMSLALPQRARRATGLLLAGAVLAGCGSNVKLDDAAKPPVEVRSGTTVPGGAGAAPGSTSQSNVASVDLTKKDAMAMDALQRVIYFDYDSYVLKDDFRPVVEGQAKSLSTDRKKRLAIEGHTDERGGREYNLALGQKRAEAVAKALVLLGAADNQVEAVSFGKERPAAQGTDEASYAKNRRAELVSR